MEHSSVSIAPMVETSGVRTSRRQILKGAAVAVAGLAAGLGTPLTAWAGEDEDEARTILRFSTMAGIHPPFLGDAGLAAFRGVHGGGAPWVVSEARGSLTTDGELEIRVRGLVLDPAHVPAPADGTNPIPAFMAIVSGFSTSLTQPVNLVTGQFPASTEGDSDIEATLDLPHPFFAPIIFVTSLPLGNPAMPRWFSVTGMQ